MMCFRDEMEGGTADTETNLLLFHLAHCCSARCREQAVASIALQLQGYFSGTFHIQRPICSIFRLMRIYNYISLWQIPSNHYTT